LTYEHLKALIDSEGFSDFDQERRMEFLMHARASAHSLSFYEDEIRYFEVLKKIPGYHLPIAAYSIIAECFYNLGNKEKAKENFLAYFNARKKREHQLSRRRKGKNGLGGKVGAVLITPEILFMAIDSLSFGKKGNEGHLLKGLYAAASYFQEGRLQLNDKGMIAIPSSLLLTGKSLVIRGVPLIGLLNSEGSFSEQKEAHRARKNRRARKTFESEKGTGQARGYHHVMDMVIQDRKREGAAIISKVAKKKIEFLQKLFKNNNFSSKVFEVNVESAIAFQKSIAKLGEMLESIQGLSSSGESSETMRGLDSESVALTRKIFDEIVDAARKLDRLEKALKDELNAHLKRKQVAKSDSTTPIVRADSPERSEKYFTMKRHEELAKKVKKKTRGIAAPVEEEEEEDSTRIDEGVVNSIITCSEAVNIFFQGGSMDGYPSTTLAYLKTLNESENLGSLRVTLRKTLSGSNLKQLDGKNKGVWQFRINDTYRVRFELNPDGMGFVNVDVTDFH